MLTELAEYARSHNLAARAGFKPKSVKAYICLSADGRFLGVRALEKGAPPVYVPDIGSAANGTRFCNPLVEKAKIPLNIVEDEQKDRNIPTKHEFYLSMLDSGGVYEPKFLIVAQALRSEETRTAMRSALAENKLKSGDPVGFEVDGLPLERSEAYIPWWSEFRKRFTGGEKSDGLPRCLISGELAPALETVPKVSGLIAVGGHTAGDAFLCFDKDAFQSYGLKKSANAPVSEEAMTAVNAALTALIAKAPKFAGAKQVYWYAGEVPEDEDPFGELMAGWDDGDGDEAEEDETLGAAEDAEERERDALKAAGELHTGVAEGKRPPELYARYYIMPLSGANGRMMVRGWYEGSFESLRENIGLWFEDLKLVAPYGRGLTRPPKLGALSIRLLKPGGDSKKVWDRMDKELANLSGRLLEAIINGHPLPDEVASRALRYIRSAMLAAGDQEESRKSTVRTEHLSFQLLKAWLRRKQRQRGDKNIMGTDINSSPHTVAYCCGQLMAVYSAIQSKAMPEVNVSVAERYYAAASTTPAFVIGKLAQLSQHHLSKLEGGLPVYYQRILSEIYEQIGRERIPTTLNQEQQSEFALGYYQQQAALYAPAEKK